MKIPARLDLIGLRGYNTIYLIPRLDAGGAPRLSFHDVRAVCAHFPPHLPRVWLSRPIPLNSSVKMRAKRSYSLRSAPNDLFRLVSMDEPPLRPVVPVGAAVTTTVRRMAVIS